MKTLNNHVILYDAECPMCNMYTKAFVQTGLLEINGRAPYQSLDENACPMVDRQRAVNEIALVNQETGEVTYGIKSLFKIISTALPALKYVFNFGPFISLMSRAYAFISYNRRVIIPAKGTSEFQYQPTFRLKYRIVYLFFTWTMTSFILTAYAHLLIGVVPIGSAYREYLVCGGQIFFQGLIVSLIAKEKKWDYLGNMMTISFAGSLLLGFVLLAAHWIGHQPIFYTAYFMLVAGLMFLEHIRRTKLLQWGWTLTITWALYRAALLLLILLTN
jgi:predicted DCC family thiol-disulfide oxidoreductase YuxK